MAAASARRTSTCCRSTGKRDEGVAYEWSPSIAVANPQADQARPAGPQGQRADPGRHAARAARARRDGPGVDDAARTASAPTTTVRSNGQADLYLDGVATIAKAIIVGDLFNAGPDKDEYRRGGSYRHSTRSYHHYDGRWLASRMPEPRPLRRIHRPEDARAVRQVQLGQHISLPSHIEEDDRIGAYAMCLPAGTPRPASTAPNYAALTSTSTASTTPAMQYGNNEKAASRRPSSATPTATASPTRGSGRSPSSRATASSTSGTVHRRQLHAINVNTAWQRDFDYTEGSGHRLPNLGFTPSNIGMEELLSNPGAEMDGLNSCRFGRHVGREHGAASRRHGQKARRLQVELAGRRASTTASAGG